MKSIVSSAVSVSLIFSSVGFAGEPVEATTDKKVEATFEKSNTQATTSASNVSSGQNVLYVRKMQERIDEITKERELNIKSQFILKEFVAHIAGKGTKIPVMLKQRDFVNTFRSVCIGAGVIFGAYLYYIRHSYTSVRVAVAASSAISFFNGFYGLSPSDEAKFLSFIEELSPADIVKLHKKLIERENTLISERQRLEAELQMSLK